MANCDLLVIGGGPGGYDAARAGAEAGLKTILVEAGELGGTCLNWGCIPTKLYLGATDHIRSLQAAAKLRLIPRAEPPVFDMAALIKRKERTLSATHKAMAKTLAEASIGLIRGRASLKGKGVAEVLPGEKGERAEPERVLFTHCIIATGSRPLVIPAMAPDGHQAGGCVLDSNQLLALTEMPESLLVVGGGAIGLELADFFHRLGTKITLVEGQERLLPAEDPEIGQTMGKLLKREGYDLRTSARVASLVTEHGQAVLTLEDGETVQAKKALVAVGRSPNTEGLGLDEIGAVTDQRGFIKTDSYLRAASNTCAIGDVNGRVLLAHAASDQGRYAAASLAGQAGSYAAGPIPGCVYGTTEVMRAGETAAELAAKGLHVRASTAPLAANPMAQAKGATQGFVKVLWVEDVIHGVTAIGHGVSHLVTQADLICAERWTRDRALAQVIAHPSLDEALHAAFAAERTAGEGVK